MCVHRDISLTPEARPWHTKAALGGTGCSAAWGRAATMIRIIQRVALSDLTASLGYDGVSSACSLEPFKLTLADCQ